MATRADEIGAIRFWGDEMPAWFEEFIDAPDSEMRAPSRLC